MFFFYGRNHVFKTALYKNNICSHDIKHFLIKHTSLHLFNLTKQNHIRHCLYNDAEENRAII